MDRRARSAAARRSAPAGGGRGGRSARSLLKPTRQPLNCDAWPTHRRARAARSRRQQLRRHVPPRDRLTRHFDPRAFAFCRRAARNARAISASVCGGIRASDAPDARPTPRRRPVLGRDDGVPGVRPSRTFSSSRDASSASGPAERGRSVSIQEQVRSGHRAAWRARRASAPCVEQLLRAVNGVARLGREPLADDLKYARACRARAAAGRLRRRARPRATASAADFSRRDVAPIRNKGCEMLTSYPSGRVAVPCTEPAAPHFSSRRQLRHRHA